MKKFRKKFNLRLFKKGDCYNSKELCNLLGIKEGTIFNWIKQGLQKAKNCGNHLFFNAEDVKDFLCTRQTKRKQKCQENEFFCFKCKKPRSPFGNMVDYVQITEKVACLKSICEICESKINKNISSTKLQEFSIFFHITKLCIINLIVLANLISIYS